MDADEGGEESEEEVKDAFVNVDEAKSTDQHEVELKPHQRQEVEREEEEHGEQKEKDDVVNGVNENDVEIEDRENGKYQDVEKRDDREETEEQINEKRMDRTEQKMEDEEEEIGGEIIIVKNNEEEQRDEETPLRGTTEGCENGEMEEDEEGGEEEEQQINREENKMNAEKEQKAQEGQIKKNRTKKGEVDKEEENKESQVEEEEKGKEDNQEQNKEAKTDPKKDVVENVEDLENEDGFGKMEKDRDDEEQEEEEDDSAGNKGLEQETTNMADSAKYRQEEALYSKPQACPAVMSEPRSLSLALCRDKTRNITNIQRTKQEMMSVPLQLQFHKLCSSFAASWRRSSWAVAVAHRTTGNYEKEEEGEEPKAWSESWRLCHFKKPREEHVVCFSTEHWSQKSIRDHKLKDEWRDSWRMNATQKEKEEKQDEEEQEAGKGSEETS